MQAIELTAVITQDNKIYLKLPADVKATHAKVIIMYEDNLTDNTQRLTKKWDVFFASKSVFDDEFLAERDNDIPQERKFY